MATKSAGKGAPKARRISRPRGKATAANEGSDAACVGAHLGAQKSPEAARHEMLHRLARVLQLVQQQRARAEALRREPLMRELLREANRRLAVALAAHGKLPDGFEKAMHFFPALGQPLPMDDDGNELPLYDVEENGARRWRVQPYPDMGEPEIKALLQGAGRPREIDRMNQYQAHTFRRDAVLKGLHHRWLRAPKARLGKGRWQGEMGLEQTALKLGRDLRKAGKKRRLPALVLMALRASRLTPVATVFAWGTREEPDLPDEETIRRWLKREEII